MNIKNIMSSKLGLIFLGCLLSGNMMMAAGGTVPTVYKAKEIFNSIIYTDYLKNIAIVEILGVICPEDNKVLNGQTIAQKTLLIKLTGNVLETADKSTLLSFTDAQYMDILTRLIVVTNMDTLIAHIDKTKTGKDIITDLITRVRAELEFSQQGIFKFKAASPILDAVLKVDTGLAALITAVLGSDYKKPATITTETITTGSSGNAIAVNSETLEKNIALLNGLMAKAFDLVKNPDSKKNTEYLKPTLIDITKITVTDINDKDISALELVSKADYDSKTAAPAPQQQNPTNNEDASEKWELKEKSDEVLTQIKNMAKTAIEKKKKEIESQADSSEKTKQLKQIEKEIKGLDDIKFMGTGKLTLFIVLPAIGTGALGFVGARMISQNSVDSIQEASELSQ